MTILLAIIFYNPSLKSKLSVLSTDNDKGTFSWDFIAFYNIDYCLRSMKFQSVFAFENCRWHVLPFHKHIFKSQTVQNFFWKKRFEGKGVGALNDLQMHKIHISSRERSEDTGQRDDSISFGSEKAKKKKKTFTKKKEKKSTRTEKGIPKLVTIETFVVGVWLMIFWTSVTIGQREES